MSTAVGQAARLPRSTAALLCSGAGGRTGLLALVALAGIGAACLSVIPSEAQSDILDEERACTGTAPDGEDSECIGIQAGGCSCNSDGAMTAVNAAFVDEIEARRFAAAPSPCNAAISDSETCCANGAACVDGRCELVGPRGLSLQSDCGGAIEAVRE